MTISSLNLSAQDTLRGKLGIPPIQGKETTGVGHIHDTIFIQYEASSKKLITEKYLLHLRNKAVILSSVGSGCIPIGACLLVRAPAISGDPSISYLAGGTMLLFAGVGISLAGVGSWIFYGVKRHKFKKQQEEDDLHPHFNRGN